jgi:hypothetical protein
MRPAKLSQITAFGLVILLAAGLVLRAQTPAAQTSALPSTPLTYGFLTVTFNPDGTFVLSGTGWPKLTGAWKATAGEVEFTLAPAPAQPGCADPGKYRYRREGTRVEFELIVRRVPDAPHDDRRQFLASRRREAGDPGT